MQPKSGRSWLGQVGLFFVLSLLFSAFPFLSSMLLNKSSLGLAIFTAWYAVVPPVVILILAWLLYRGEHSWLALIGRIWVSLGLWFGLQLLLSSLVNVHILVRLFALPAAFAGNVGYWAGTLIFLAGGIILWFVAGSVEVPQPADRSQTLFGVSAGVMLALVVIGLPLLIILTARPAPGEVDEAAIPTTDEVFGYVSDVYNLGIRRPGWDATQQASQYIVEQLTSYGFEDVRVDESAFDLWRENDWSLVVDPDGEDWAPETYFVPYSGNTGPGGVTAEVVYVGDGSQEELAGVDLEGRILFASLPPTDITWDQMAIFTYLAYDPDDTVADWGHPYPIGWLPKVEHLQEVAAEEGAVGMIGILRDYPEMGDFGYYAPYNGVIKSIPGLYLLDDDGDRLIKMVEAGDVTATLTLDASDSDQGTVWTVYGVLPGQRDEVIMVHSHYDAPWQSGIEDSSGVGMVLGLARYYAQLPQSEREYTMVFFLAGSHMIGAQGNFTWMEDHPEIMDKLLVDVCIEHIADDYNPPAAPTGVEPRGNFIRENPVMISHYAGAVTAHDASRLLLFPTGTPLGVPTDAGMFARDGYAVSSLISGPVWLFDDDDTLERVAKDELGPLSAMYIDFIDRLDNTGKGLLRFNLNVWSMVGMVLLTPLAVLSAIHWPAKKEE